MTEFKGHETLSLALEGLRRAEDGWRLDWHEKRRRLSETGLRREGDKVYMRLACEGQETE